MPQEAGTLGRLSWGCTGLEKSDGAEGAAMLLPSSFDAHRISHTSFATEALGLAFASVIFLSWCLGTEAPAMCNMMISVILWFLAF